MATVTISKTKYNLLKRQAALYKSLLSKESMVFPVEMYTQDRMRGFLKEDAFGSKLRRKIVRSFRKKS